MTTLGIDIETYSSNDLRKCGVYKYVEASDFEILLLAFAFDNDPVKVVDICSGEMLPAEVEDAIYSDCLKTAFNANFERVCISRFFNAPADPEFWECTMVKAGMLGLPMDLKNVAKILNLSEQKIDEEKALIRYFTVPCKPTKANGRRTRNLPEHAPDKWQSFKIYNGQDVETERAVRKEISWFPFPENEKILWNLDQKINDTGIKLNRTLIRNSISFDKTYKNRIVEKAKALTSLDNPNSTAQVKAWLTSNNESVESLNKEAVVNLIKSTDSDKIRKMMKLRLEMNKTSVKKFNAMANGICSDGRLRGLLQFYGANRTGRWAGRMVQVHNLPKNNLEDLDYARNLVLEDDLDGLDTIYGVSNTLSELIRTAFVPDEGKQLVVTDFSAIEARVLAWLAKERWRIDFFKTKGDIYRASASQMFKVPLETIPKSSPLRQRGKVSELALGYQGGVNALIKMGALKMGLTEEELPPLVNAWRHANPNIVRFWDLVGNAAINAVNGARSMIRYGIKFFMRKGCLVIELPSGRQLFYQHATIGTNRFGGECIRYYGMDQTTKKWSKQDTYGGKLVENCFAADTQVLAKQGWIKITEVTNDTTLWDGADWVSCEGLVYKNQQTTLDINGVRMTADQKILTNEGWKNASSCEGHNRSEVQLPNSYFLCRIKRKKISLAGRMHMWKANNKRSFRVEKRKNKILWLQIKRIDRIEEQYSWNESASSLLGLEINERQMQTSNTSSVAQLRRKRNNSLRKMASIHQLLGRHGAYIQERPFVGKKQRERELREKQLFMGNYEEANKEQKKQHIHEFSVGTDNSWRSVREIRNWEYNNLLQAKAQLSRGTFTCNPGRYEPVYDIINSGPRNRFVVNGIDGPFIVHNCTQAIARDILANAMINVDKAGHIMVMHVHDEIVAESQKDETILNKMNEILSEPVSWAPGLELSAAGFMGNYYKKD